MNTLAVGDVTTAILNGSLDNDIASVEQAMKMRKETLKGRMMRQLRAGDVVVVDNIRPKAICGLQATVKKVNRTTLSVVFGPDAGKYAGPCKVPASCCQKV